LVLTSVFAISSPTAMALQQRLAHRRASTKGRQSQDLEARKALPDWSNLSEEEQHREEWAIKGRYRGGIEETRTQIARLFQEVRRRRQYEHRRIAHALTRPLLPGSVIYHEALNVDQMIRRPQPIQDEETNEFEANGRKASTAFRRSIAGVGWAEFIQALTETGAKTGVSVVAVDAANTTQACHVCGTLADPPHPYWQEHQFCQACGWAGDTDLNAARNVLSRGNSVREKHEQEKQEALQETT
jgi:transposase